MNKIYYFAAYTDSGCILGCIHKHKTVTTATACLSSAGGYVIGVENGVPRALTDAEEAEFQHAMYGKKVLTRSDVAGYMFLVRVRFKTES
jgi:hypothetical protein